MLDPLDLTVFTVGDSRKISTWSNVPYFFTRTLERQGHRVHRVDIGPDPVLKLAYDLVWNTWCTLTGRPSEHEYFRSRINHALTSWQIERAMRRRPNNHNIFLTFSFGANRDRRPYTLFCDRTFEKQIDYLAGRSARPLEERTVERERRNLREAEHVVSLFPEMARELKVTYGNKVKYYGNVVNLDLEVSDADGILAEKERSIELVFIGGDKYRPGLELLVQAVAELNARGGPSITVHVIGMKRGDLRQAPANVIFHGYLDKAVPEQRQRYSEILRKAYLFVNPSPKWASFSASCEAMFLYTPVVIFPYAEFMETFGPEANVGAFLREESPAHIADVIAELVQDRARWRTKAHAAHAAVKHFTWDAYVQRFVQDLRVRQVSTIPVGIGG
jgi:glycosyltransferase involved in cell wall biosynthesis